MFQSHSMKLLLLSVAYLFVLCESSLPGFLTNPKINYFNADETNSDDYLNSLKIIRKYGYPAEAHVVETADGYLLEMHRIPHGKNVTAQKSEEMKKKPPVFMQHGLLGSSADFLLTGPKRALAFRLADLGYDVWMGNVRSNVYSRGHESLFPSDRRFWNFSWHESAIYDLPAQIDFVRNYTNEEKVVYVGYSMGTTMFFALTSTLPEYNDKIELSLLMAPVAYAKHMKSPLIRLLAPMSEKLTIIYELLQNGEFLPESKLLQIIGKIFCEATNTEARLCMNTIFLVLGSDPKQFDKSFLNMLIGHYPTGYSARGVNHFSQLVMSGKFRQYDFGEKRNKAQYGSLTPPDYVVGNIKIPMYFYVGKNDYLSTEPDVKTLAKQLTTLRRLRIIDYPKFTHLDFLISKNVTELVNDPLIEDLTNFLKIAEK